MQLIVGGELKLLVRKALYCKKNKNNKKREKKIEDDDYAIYVEKQEAYMLG